ncbi:MAG: enoyl-CoA hydratase [Pseudomonadota bacterium]
MNERLPLQTEKIIAEIRGAVGWIAIHNPERRNAVSREMWTGLGDAATAFGADPRVRAVVLYGTGGKAFAAGADISEFDAHRADAEQQQAYNEIASRGRVALGGLAKPLVAMVDGFCIGGGLAIALQADVRFASPGSRFGIPAARLGLGYGYDGLARLARLVGPSTARDMLFSARQLQADEALRCGLVNFVVEGADLLARVAAYADTIARNAPLTVRAAKAAMNAFESYTEQAETSEVEALVKACFDSADYQEGRTAFMEKRPPHFNGS